MNGHFYGRRNLDELLLGSRGTDEQTNVLRTDHLYASHIRLGSSTEGLPQSTYAETMQRPLIEDVCRRPKYKPIGDAEAFLQRIHKCGNGVSQPLPDPDANQYLTTHRAAYNLPSPPSHQPHETAVETPEESWVYRRRKSMFYGNAVNHVTGQDTWSDELCPCPVCSQRPQKPAPLPPSPGLGSRPTFQVVGGDKTELQRH